MVTDNGAIDIGDDRRPARSLTLDDGTTITGGGTGTLTIDASNGSSTSSTAPTTAAAAPRWTACMVTDNGAIASATSTPAPSCTLDDGTTITGGGTGTLTINAGNTLDVEHGGNRLQPWRDARRRSM